MKRGKKQNNVKSSKNTLAKNSAASKLPKLNEVKAAVARRDKFNEAVNWSNGESIVDAYVCVVFPDQDTAIEFLQKAGWFDYSEDGIFVDGIALAEAIEVKLTKRVTKFKTSRSNEKLAEEVGTFQPSRQV